MGWSIRRTAAWTYRAALHCSAALVTAAVMSNAALATDYAGGNGAQGATGSFPNSGCVCNSGQAGGTGGVNGFGGGNAASGAPNNGYSNFNLGGIGGAADGGGGGGYYYSSGAGGSGGGAGGAGYLLGDGGTLNSAGAVTGGNGGDGGYSTFYYGVPYYSKVGGGGGGGGGSGVIATGTATLTNSGNITGGTGGTGAFANYADFSSIYAYPSDSGAGGAGGYGVRADSATSLTLNNSGNITGGDAGFHAFAGYGAGSAGVYGQNITLYNTGGTIKGGYGATVGTGIELTGGTNTLNISAGTITSDSYGLGIKVDSGTNTFNISGGTVSAGQYGTIAVQINGGANTLNVTGGTLGAVNLVGGATTLQGTGYSSTMTLAHGATAFVTTAGGDVSGITSFDNHGGLSLDAGRSITIGAFTNEADGTLTLGAGATLVSSNLNLIAGSTITGAGSLSSGSATYGLSSGTISASLAGTGGLNKTGSGTLTLTGANSYTGGTNITGGVLSITDGALGGGDVHMAQGTTIQFTGSSFTTSNSFFISGDPVFDVASGTTQTLNNVIADDTSVVPNVPGVVEKTGAGILVLSGDNTYTGGTIIEDGTLTLWGASTRSGNTLVSSAIGTGTLTLDGGTARSAGTTLWNDIAVAAGGGTLDAHGGNFWINGAIGGSGDLTLADSNPDPSGLDTIYLYGPNTLSGTTTVSVWTLAYDGALSADSDYNLQGGKLEMAGSQAATIKSLAGDSASELVLGNLTLSPAGGSTSFAGVLRGGSSSSLTLDGAAGAAQILSRDNSATFHGGVIVTSGVLGAGADNALGDGAVTLNGGTLRAEGDYGLGNTVYVNGTSGTVDANSHALSLAALADGSGVTGGTSLVIASSGGAGTVILTGNSSYTGAIQVDTDATLKQGGGNSMPGGAYLVNGGLQISSASIASLDGSGTVQDSGSGGTLDIEVANGSASFSGVISDSGIGADILALTKGGAGTQTLSAANTYSGGTTLNAGTLVAGEDSALGTGGIILNGGTLSLVNGVLASNAVAIQGDAALNIASGAAGLSGAITDDAPATAHTVTKTGAGTLTLSGANGSSVNMKLSAGTLEIGNQSAIGGNYIFDGGTLKVDGSWTIAGNIEVLGGGTFDTNGYDTELTGELDSTSNPLAITGAGSVKISGINNLSGGAAIAAATTLEAAGASGLGAGDVAMATGSAINFTTTSGIFTNDFFLDGATIFDVDTGLVTSLSGVIADAPAGSPGSLEKTGAGTLALSAANTYSGGTTLTGGILRVDGNGVAGTGTVTFNGGALQAGGDYTFGNAVSLSTAAGTVDANGYRFALSGIISGSSALTILDSRGGGVVTLSGANTYTGGSIIQGTTAMLGSGTTASSGPLGKTGAVVLDGGTLRAGMASAFYVFPIELTATGGTLSADGRSVDFTGVISDHGGAAGVLTLNAVGDTGTVTLSGSNSYTGGTIIAGGTVGVSGASALGNAGSAVEMKAGTALDIASGASLANALILDDTTPVLNVDSGTGTLSGGVLELSGTPGGFTKTGTGTLLLTGGSNTSGVTAVSGGTLEIGDGAASYAAAYQVSSGATLAFDAQTLNYALIGSLAGDGGVTSVSSLEVGGAGANSDDTTFSGAITTPGLTYNGGGTLTLTGGGNDFGALIVCACVTSGGITLSGGSSMAASSGVGVEAGTFTVMDGVQLTTPDFEQSGGIVAISGAGTSVDATNGGAGLIGVYTNGGSAPVFTVSGGAQLSSDTLLAGIIGGAGAPQITITGTGSQLSLTGGVALDNGTQLTIADGATLAAPSITLNNGAALSIGAGAAPGIAGDASATIQGLSADTHIIADFAGDATLDAMLTGALALNVQQGNLTLTNAINDYSGGTSIGTNSVLILQDSSAGTGAIADSGFLAISNTNASSFTYNLSGPGGLAQIGDGALAINTAQVYTGRTVIAPNSTLFLTGAGDLSHSSTVEAYGTFDVSGVTASNVSITSLYGDGDVEIGSRTLIITGDGGVFSGILSDGGAQGGLEILGNQVLNGIINLTGTTTFGSGSTITVSGPGALGGGALTFEAGSTLKFGASGTYTNAMTFEDHAPVFDVTGQMISLSGAIDGPGDLAVTGSGGTLTLTNTGNSYAGGTEVYGASTLRLDADGELGGVAALQLGNATSKGTLKYAGAFALASGRAITVNAGGGAIDTNGNDVTIASAIGGNGALTKTGSGNLILSGVSTLTGATTVSGGTLSVNGSLASSAVTVASGGKLGGTGTVGATTVASGGGVAPGNSIGTLHVNGDLTLASGATTAIEISPGAADQIAVSGTASLGGALAFAQGAGTYAAGTEFKLLTASAVNGVFSSVTGLNITGLDANIAYSVNAVDLVLSAPAAGGGSGGGGSGSGGDSGGGGSGRVTNSFLFGSYGVTANQVAAGNALADGANNGGLYTAAGNLVAANRAAVPGALGQLAGDIHASLRGAVIEDSRLLRDSVLRHMDVQGEGTQVWASAFGGYGGIAGDGNAAGLHHDSAGFVAGADTPVVGGMRAGLAGAYAGNSARTGDRAATASGGSGHVLAYANWRDGAVDLRLGGDYGWGSATVTRAVAALSQALSDRQDQRSDQVFFEGGYHVATGLAEIEPYAGLTHASATSGAFAETGGSAALSGGEKTGSQTFASFGLRAALGGALGDARITPRADIAWQHAFGRFQPGQILTLTDAAQSFTVLGAPLNQDSAAVQLGAGMAIAPNVALRMGYDGSFGNRAQSHAITGSVDVKF